LAQTSILEICFDFACYLLLSASMQTRDFDYTLPENLIAQFPLKQRQDSRLLVLDGDSGQIDDRQFGALPDLLRAGDLLVLNDTKVIPARLFGQKQSGGKVEVLVETITSDRTALAHVKASKSPKPGSRMILESSVEVEVTGREGDLFALTFLSAPVMASLEQYGHVPLPPYIQRDADSADLSRYQTVYANTPGAVAAPTAGLHFSEAMLANLVASGISLAYVTLHVGAGTFQPVRAEDIDDHDMHEESVWVCESVCEQVRQTKACGGRVVAVGTTAVRSLETASRSGEIMPYSGRTNLFLYPGKSFHCVDAMITNFHLPQSTLLMLVCAFAGFEHVMQAYQHAVEQQYRFFSYGDAMFVTPGSGAERGI
jgi:S-adenosylmethionine:tRNA ribosyltransferase-isomerase